MKRGATVYTPACSARLSGNPGSRRASILAGCGASRQDCAKGKPCTQSAHAQEQGGWRQSLFPTRGQPLRHQMIVDRICKRSRRSTAQSRCCIAVLIHYFDEKFLKDQTPPDPGASIDQNSGHRVLPGGLLHACCLIAPYDMGGGIDGGNRAAAVMLSAPGHNGACDSSGCRTRDYTCLHG